MQYPTRSLEPSAPVCPDFYLLTVTPQSRTEFANWVSQNTLTPDMVSRSWSVDQPVYTASSGDSLRKFGRLICHKFTNAHFQQLCQRPVSFHNHKRWSGTSSDSASPCRPKLSFETSAL